MRTSVLLSVLVLMSAACSGPDDDNTVSGDAGTATVVVGEALWVHLGGVSDSVGDIWYLVEDPDASVLTEAERSYERPLACDLGLTDGCDAQLYWGFNAVAAGETTLVFQYCLRTLLEECEGANGEAPEPVELAVVVTE